MFRVSTKKTENSHKTLSMPQFTIGIDDFLVHFETLFTTRANHIAQGVGCHDGTEISQKYTDHKKLQHHSIKIQIK